MGKTRVHLLAKELGIETKDLIVQLDRLGLRGRKAQSALEDDEVVRVRAALAAQEKPQIHVGEEKIVADRVVKSEDEGDGGAEARETVIERRVRTNVIRRRVNRTEVAPVEMPGMTTKRQRRSHRRYNPPRCPLRTFLRRSCRRLKRRASGTRRRKHRSQRRHSRLAQPNRLHLRRPCPRSRKRRHRQKRRPRRRRLRRRAERAFLAAST